MSIASLDRRMTKVVFLDCDGVVNSLHRWPALPDHPIGHGYKVDPLACQRLNQIVQGVNAAIVISSCWREGLTLDQLREILGAQGLDAQRIIDKTGSSKEGVRGWEIAAWLNKNSWVERYIIIDDDSDDLGPLKTRLLKTSWELGLMDAHVPKAISMLEGD